MACFARCLRLAQAAGLLLLCASASSAIAQEAASTARPNHEVTKQQARTVAGQFAATLKPTLLAAIQQGGPAHAVSVCAEEAPQIAASLSQTSGWMVRRVSLKPRNPAATPDEFEQRVLEQFDVLVATGQQPAAFFEIDGEEARMLVPQITEGLCLTCHGEPTPEVQSELRQHYPTDSATGYTLGEIRGAISLRKRLDDED